MKENNNTPLVWNNIPEWAIFALEYGIEEELFLTDEDKDLITRFIGENFPNGYTMSVDLNPEKPDVPLNKNDAFQKVQKRRVQEKR